MSMQYGSYHELIERITRLESRIRELEQSEAESGNRYNSLYMTTELYKGMINTIPDFLILTDLKGKIRFVNESTIRSSGLDRYEIEGMNLLIFLPPEEMNNAIYNASLMFQEKQGPAEFTFIKKDGNRIPFEINGDVLVDANGNPSGFVFICRDMTNRRSRYNTVNGHEEGSRCIPENVPGVFFEFCAGENEQYRLNYVSERITEYSGLRLENLDELYMSFIASIHDDDRSEVFQSFLKSWKEGVPWNYIFRYVKPSGEVMWLHGLSAPSFHDNEVIFSGIMIDIPGFKHPENVSGLSEGQYSRIFMTLPESIAVTRIDNGLFIDVNSSFEEVMGWRRDEIIGRCSVDMDIWEDPLDRDFMKGELESGRDVISCESLFRRKDGSVCSALYSARPIQIGDEACLVFVFQDTTERKQMEIDRLNREQHLLNSQKMDAIGQLAGGVAHDFNNILMAIQGNTSLMLMRCKPEDYNYIRLLRIEESVKRGSNLTNQLLGFAGGGKYELKTLSVNDLLEKGVLFFLKTQKDIEVELDLQDDVFPVEVDPGQMDQVFLNLFINAAQAMPCGGRLFITTSNVNIRENEARAFGFSAGGYVKISVTDTGIGMEKDILSRIFEPFFSTRSAQGGAGLGLASVYGIIQNHNGVIKVFSEPGHGATFDIYLPSSGKSIDFNELENDTELFYGKGSILVVDDEEAILDYASELLGMLGYTVYTALSGVEAIDIFSRKSEMIDLIIMDMIMPGIKGTVLLQKLRDINPGVKVILSSGYSMQGEVRKAMEKGCQGFIQKPFKMNEFSAIVNKVLKAAEIL